MATPEMPNKQRKSVLVAYGSRHGATREIADAIGDAIRHAGMDVNVTSVESGVDASTYEAVVLGSAVYMGRWLNQARDWALQNKDALKNRPLWLFSSGPIGNPLKPDQDPVDVADLSASMGARAHRRFGGRLDKSRLSFGEKAVVWGVGAEEGDFRPWDDIARFGAAIAQELRH
jgi:menaquinone-dependent protoporphyrinogen oxidase